MNKKLKLMTEKASFSAYRLTSNASLEILSQKPKIPENYFLFDGKDYYFGNHLLTVSSAAKEANTIILAATETKLFIPQENDEFLYIARNFPADKDLLVVVLYHCDNYLHFLIVGGNGSGRVHPIYMPFTADNYLFCFHAAINAIATVDPEMAETLYTDLQQKAKETKDRKSGESH